MNESNEPFFTQPNLRKALLFISGLTLLAKPMIPSSISNITLLVCLALSTIQTAENIVDYLSQPLNKTDSAQVGFAVGQTLLPFLIIVGANIVNALTMK